MRIVHTTIKMTLVTLVAGLISRWIGLEYWLTGGILALLSIQLTKKDSMIIAAKRILDVFYAMFLSIFLFWLFGYEFWVFIVLVFILVLSSFYFKIQEGIVPALVVVTHFLVKGSFSFEFLIEESLLVIVSIGIAMIFNTFYPTGGEKVLIKYIETIDGYMKDHLMMLSFLVKDPEYHETYSSYYNQLEQKLKSIIQQVEITDKNILFQNDQSYLAYVYMRSTQARYLNHMFEQAVKVKCIHPYAEEIAIFIKKLCFAIGHYDEGQKHLNTIHEMLSKYRLSDLPKTRDEFESRAILYQILLELESFIQVKLEFYKTYPKFNVSK
ncbi:hypothetical protein BK011_06885 [Tenericutes bacterium MZ-XQ]|nr:hypothetical protein BK011_06885 [Tenericutes bacterium MZ-XQ]